jgi:hypothetical protein
MAYDKEDHGKRDQVESGVESESASWCDLGQKSREGERQGAANSIVDADRKSGANFTMREREGFGKVNGRDGANAYVACQWRGAMNRRYACLPGP